MTREERKEYKKAWREDPWIERYQSYDKLFETPEEACEFYAEIIKHFKDYCLTEETNLI